MLLFSLQQKLKLQTFFQITDSCIMSVTCVTVNYDSVCALVIIVVIVIVAVCTSNSNLPLIVNTRLFFDTELHREIPEHVWLSEIKPALTLRSSVVRT